jgi:MFS family permease
VFLAVVLLVVLATTARLDLHAAPSQGTKAVRADLFRQRALLSALSASVAFYTTVGVLESSWSVLLRDRGAETWLIGLTLSMFAVPAIFLAPIGGRLAQQRGPLRIVGACVAIATTCTFSYGVFNVLWVLLAIAVVHSVADSFIMPGNQVAVALATPQHQLAAGQGLLGAAGLATAGVVGLVSGWTYQHAGPFAVFAGASAWMLLCIGAALVMGRDLLRPAAPSVIVANTAIAVEQSVGLP